MSAPVISVQFDLDTEEHVLYATSHGRTEVAGPRILRAPPHPDIKWRHATQTAASHDAGLLQRYLDGVNSKVRKRAQRTFGE